ncbi:hypothetical protein BJF90_26375 [Pseudonocardia sp. CNS-004]|nr:hypothetical protein BJF90_26375 [Pseudonocardia sp. CNS-004]
MEWTKNAERYREVVTEMLALAAEAGIRAMGDESPGYVPYSWLSQLVTAAVCEATEMTISDKEIGEMATAADELAIGRIAERNAA